MFLFFLFALSVLLIVSIISFVVLYCVVALFKSKRAKAKRKKENKDEVVFGFFHPYCNAGGGGERVLWCAVQAMQTSQPKAKIIIYTGDVGVTPGEFVINVKNQFGIDIENVEFVYLNSRHWVEAKRYPIITLLGQSLGSIVLGMEAFNKFVPDIFIDTMGYAFVLPIFKTLGKCQTVSYVHYPTISTDMLDKVLSSEKSSHNNSISIKRSPFLTNLKAIYYRAFAKLYGFMGSFSDKVMVNSTWTYGHVASIWKCNPSIVFPPCNVSTFQKLDLSKKESGTIVSIAQFRPEKDHPLQLKALAEYFRNYPDKKKTTKLTLIGGCRNKDDKERVTKLKILAKTLDIDDQVFFILNASFERLTEELSKSQVGLHTMWNEHFGIGIVEYMAGLAIPLAHNSGGPKADIIPTKNLGKTGFLASSVEEYAKKLHEIFSLSKSEIENMQKAARADVFRFSDEKFYEDWNKCMNEYVKKS